MAIPYYPEKELSRVRIVQEGHPAYRCLSCGQSWTPPGRSGVKMPPRWWRCPGGCNRHILRGPSRRQEVK